MSACVAEFLQVEKISKTIDQTFSNADDALYIGKSRGGNEVAVWKADVYEQVESAQS